MAIDCACCGIQIMGMPGVKCASCASGECDPSVTWHCFTGHCDGSGCTYPGECEGAARPGVYGITSNGITSGTKHDVAPDGGAMCGVKLRSVFPAERFENPTSVLFGLVRCGNCERKSA